MLRRILRKLFRRNSATGAPAHSAPSLPADSDASDTTSSDAAEGSLHVADVGVPSVGVPTVGTPSYDAAAAWSARLADVQATMERDAVATAHPDASALLRLLSEGPDTMIRQLPAAARDALALCDDPAIPRARLIDRLSQDPALVQALLRTANSAAVGGGSTTVLSIDRAIDRIGLSGARASVLASCVGGLLSHPGGEYNAMAADVWAHMIRTGPLARAIAPAFAADADDAFAVALLHDVGKLVVFDRLSALRAMRRRAVSLPPAFVHYLLQRLHEPIGALAAQRWGMGARAAAAIGTHHRSDPATVRDSLAETLFVAEHADHAERRRQPLDLDALWPLGNLTGSPARVGAALQQFHAAA